MLSLYKLELKKIMKRKDFLCLMLFCLFPFLYGIGYYFKLDIVTISGNEGMKLTGVDFINAMYGLAKLTGISLILFIVIGTTTLATEIEKGQMSLILSKGVEKSKLLWVKMLSLLTIVVLFTVVYMISSGFNYVLFISKTNIGAEVFFGENTVSLIAFLVLSMLEMMVYISISFFIGLKLSTYQTIFSTIAIFVFTQILNHTKTLKYLSPSYLGNLEMASISTYGIGIFILLGYSLVIGLVTLRKFKRMELK